MNKHHAISGRGGSVLMEFIVVLPIYFVLLGMVFFYGDLSLHAVNMAASGDRTLAVSHGLGNHGIAGWSGKDAAMPYVKGATSVSSNAEDVTVEYLEGASPLDANASQYSGKTVGEVADRGFAGSWTWLAGAKLTDEYALLPVSRSFIRAWKVFADSFRMSDGAWEKEREYAEGSGLAQLFPSSGDFGRVSLVSKDLKDADGTVRRYACYTLMRNGKGRTSYRIWNAGALVATAVESAPAWRNGVYGEGYFFDGKGCASLGDYGSDGGGPASGGTVEPYGRFNQYVTWSE